MKGTLIFLTVSLLAFTSYFFLKQTSHHKVEEFKDVDQVFNYASQKCRQISFVSLNENCNKDYFCKPGLYCSSQGKCVSEKIVLKGKEEFCTSNQQCTTGVCTNNKCAETPFVRETEYCSRYLNLLRRFTQCSFKKCQTGSTFPRLSSCQKRKCHKIIKKVSDASLDEFGLIISKGKAQEFERNPTKQMSANDVTGIQQSCSITSTVVSSMFGVSGSDISIVFSNPLTTATTQITTLSTVFGNATTLGTGAVMFFVSSTLLRLQLGTNPTIQPGDYLTFVNNALVVDGCTTSPNYVNGGVSISKNPNTQPPQVIIRGPRATTLSCSIFISAADTVGAGTLNFEWSLDNITTTYAPVAIANFLAGLSRTQSSFTLSNTLFSDATNGAQFKINLNVIDYFQTQSSQSITVTVTSGTAVPLCQLVNFPAGLTVDRAVSNNFLASTSVCGTSYDSLSYTFSVSPAPQIAPTIQGSSITLAPQSLVLSTSYTVQVFVSAISGLSVVGNCTYTQQLMGTNPPLFATLAGASSQTVLNTQTSFVLDASGSSDPAGDPISYNYTCCKVNTNTGLCVTSDCTSVFTSLTSVTTSTATVTIPTSTLGQFQFTVVVSGSGSRTSSATQTITFTNAGVISLDSLTIYGTYTFAAGFSNPSQWTATVSTGSFPVTVIGSSGNKFSVSIPRNQVTTSGILAVSALNPSTNLIATLNYPIVKEVPPFNGALSIVDSTGNAVTTPLNSNSVYYIQAYNWKADHPLLYQFQSTLANAQAFSSLSSCQFTPYAVASATPAIYTVNIGYTSPIFGDIVYTTQTISFNIATYTPPNGETYEQASNNTVNAFAAAAASGSLSLALSSANLALSILSISTTPRGSSTRIATLDRIASIISSTTPSVITSVANRDATLQIASLLLATPIEITASVLAASIIALSAAAQSPNPMTTTQGQSTLGLISTCATTTPNGQDILQSSVPGLSLANAINLKKAASGVANSIALTIQNGTIPTFVNSQAVQLSIFKYALAIPTSQITAFNDGSVTLTAPGGLGSATTNVDLFHLLFIKWAANYFTYASQGSSNITSSPIGIELYNSATLQQIAVSNVQPNLNIQIFNNATSQYSTCLYLDDVNSVWSNTGVTASLVVPGQSVTCQSNHLTEFASFSTGNPNPPTNPPQNNNLLYLLLLLLLIPIAIVLAIVVIVTIVLITARIRNGDGYSKGGLHATAGVGLEDLGI